MYTLLSGLWQSWLRKDEYYVLLVGLDDAGKTVCVCAHVSYSLVQTVLEKLKATYNPRYDPLPREKICPTVGMNGEPSAIKTLAYNDEVGRVDVDRARLVFWDLGGQSELQQLWDKVNFKFFVQISDVFKVFFMFDA